MTNTIDFNDIKTQRKIIIIFVGIVITTLIWYLQIKPHTENLKEFRATTASKQEELKKILTLRPQLENMRVEVAKLQQEMDSLEAIFPINPDVPGLIMNITKIVRAQDIAIINFKPSETLQKEYYIENYYEMSVLGSYHNIGAFFAHIANFDLLVNIDKISLKVSPTLTNDLQKFDGYKGKKNSDELIRSVQVSFRITTYSSLQGTIKQ
jgi:type IV pilus assembly protein PilO